MRILFLGTPDFASVHLEFLMKNGFDVVAVISQPDKPKGRGKKILPTPVKEVALKYNIPVFQPKKLNKEGLKIIENLKPDIGIVVAYGKLLKPPFLNTLEFYNVHASLLPSYRGAAPIQRVLENGEKRTGITIFKIGEGMDDGPIALKKEVEVGEFETFGELYEKLLDLGKKALIEFLNNYPIELIPQEGKVSFAPKITKEDLKLDFSKDVTFVKNKIRAYDPLPGVRVLFKRKIVKLFGVFSVLENSSREIGKIISIDKEGALISCENGSVKVRYIQFPGKRKMTFFEAKNGCLIKEGECFDC
ncbi:methionyl-tRNA formyltransferase [Thermosipho melanesiensis]|uniref:Methionyl-tRNA formyltransferase n=2 Tax=Thermosipho melanesiensis TaxID=46541 RepID=FMT_THEM4|nr:methionyl-tRNA formyltransferase [Thermosipho melanesiensis]A6LJK9.1 RecName: Full=Methionyl-tRNA formyltransferase [Thermosipho melanesiensis BI429]ABR30110.1 methionyl-tRNA formyltransferase [Thermosipho melanesiensis BI429]APT73307.1 methionyl-tRNA formyltransferase [Thermosipho melanesiensis]OOC38698.1 methionyl-tRNA formyltransferase [Thermosipho melanesiensis]OOC40502.1 methionyl-tRNA formyltransferase [Thermosipho melanesiensis]OOC40767.1 methionyl-tRNA formyltransferase [Thermosiph